MMKGLYKSFTKNALLTILIIHLTFAGFSATYYVSSSGNDSNSGLSTSLPWKTLGKVNASTFVPGDQILFNRGDTFYGSLTIVQSGTSGSRIVYGAYGTGAKPIITGLTSVTSWTNLGSNIWESTNAVSTLSTLNMVVINGVNTPMGRTPNTGYYYYQSHSGSTSITSNNINGTPNWTGAELAFNNSDWSVKRRPITVQSGGTLTFTIDPKDTYIQKDGQKFIIQNDSRTLDTQNEWYFNPTTKKLKVYSTTQPANVQVSTIETLLTNASKNYITLDGISFIGSNSDNIVFSSASYFTIQNCTINYSGLDGIYSSWSNGSNLIVENCTIDNSNNNGIGTTPYLINCTIRSNTVTNSGIIYGANAILPDSRNGGIICHAIAATGEGSLFEYNTIDNCGYVGIRFYGTNTIVQKNIISNFCMVNTDGGGIYSWNGPNTTLSGTKVLSNILASTKAKTTYSESHLIAGIYLDDYTNGVEVADNTIIGSPMGVFLHEAYNVIVQRNTMFNNDVGLRCFGVSSPFYMVNINANNNIYVAKYAAQLTQHFDPVEKIIPTFVANNNIHARPINNTNTIHGYVRTPSFSSFSKSVAEWQAYSGQDANSTKSPQAITTDSDMRCEYNETNTPKTINLSQPMMDMRGVKYTGTITLQPYKSLVLIKDITSAAVPGAPTSVAATAGNASASISFVAPASNGGSTITGYTVTSSPAGGIDASAGSTSLSRTITGLTNGTAYTFTVKAVNSVGTSIASAPSNSVTPQANSTATTFTFSGPFSGSVNIQSTNFTVTPNNPFTGTITITPSGTGSAGLSPKVLTFSNSSVAQTFTITPTVAGSITLNAANSSTLSNPASITYTVNAVVPDAPALVITPKYSIYSFEESSGTKVIDSMSSYDGDIINTTSRVTGISGNALSSTGNGYVNLGQVYGDVQDGLTLSAWVKPTPSGGYEGVIMHGGPNTDTFALYLNYTSGTIAFKTEGTLSGKWTEIANNTIWDGSWHLLTATYNGSQKIIYLDAVPIITVSATGMIGSGAGYNLLIGAGRDEIPVPLTFQYQGIIDEVRIYNYALNSSQISSLFTITDNTSPIISSFLVPTSSTSLTVPVTTLNASDNTGVSGYLLTETPTVPSSSATGWTTTAPTSYSFSSAGTNSIYAWVKDASGNVSSSAMRMVTITLETGQGELKTSHFIPVWNGENGQNHMNFIVVSAILEDMPLATDDEIGLFSGNACVGAQILSKEINSADNTTFLTIQASQNDGSGNGFNNNDSILVRIWDKSANTELFAKAVVYRNDMPDWITSGKYSAGATAVIEIVSYFEFTQTIELKKGYNLISTNVTAENPMACQVTKPLADDGSLVKLQDETGNSLENWGSFGGWINNIGTIKSTEGYKIEVANNCTLQITGRFVALPLDISLVNGWNIISFPRNDMVDGMAVVQSLIDQGKLVKVQDETGNSIEDWGIYGGWRNGIGNFIPGKAYKIKVNADAILTIRENYLKSSVILAQAEATTYYQTKVEGNGTDHMNINIINLREAGVSEGDELAAFDGKICVGTLKITGNYLKTGTACLIATSAGDKGLDGFKSGNKIQVYLWDQETGNETEVQSEVVKGKLNYEINGSVMVKLKSSSIKVDLIDEAVKIDVFPNPSSGRVTVRFSDMPDAGSKIEITDVAGRMVSSRLISNTSEEFNFDQQTSGLYLVKTILGSNTKIHKLIIRK